MESYVLVIIFVSVSLVVTAIVVLSMRLVQQIRRGKTSDDDLPLIILTSGSPVPRVKRLWSPAKPKKNSKLKEEREAAARRRELRQHVNTFWVPKQTEETLIKTRPTFIQPAYADDKADGAIAGRLNCILHYEYINQTRRSVFSIKLMGCRDLPRTGQKAPDVFVKTSLMPSASEIFSSKVQLQTQNPDFNETYRFEVPYNVLMQQHTVSFTVLEFRPSTPHQVIGQVNIPLSELGTHGYSILREVNMWMNIKKL